MKTLKIPDLRYGKKSLKVLKELTFEDVLVVTDEVMKDTPHIEKVKHFLSNSGSLKIFSEISPNPTRENVIEGAKVAKNLQPDCILALGGGSVMDATKGIYVRYEHPQITWDEMYDENPFPSFTKGVTFIAVPSTSGTGAECSLGAVISDESVTPAKKEIMDDWKILPDIAILDPEVPSTMPSRLTAITGVDALSHSIEAFAAVGADTFTNSLTTTAVETIFKNLPKAVADGRDLDVRNKMHLASAMGAIAFDAAGLGVVHSLGHQCLEFGMPHGLAMGILMPHVLKYNFLSSAEKYKKLAVYLGLVDRESSAEVAGNRLVYEIEDLISNIGLPLSFKEYGVKKDEFQRHVENMAKSALNDGNTAANPRQPSKKRELIELYWKAWDRE